MTYTIKISDTSPQAISIINMLRTLARDYDFLQITEDSNALTAEQDRELSRRHKYVKKNPTVGKTWEEIEKSL
jgi:glutaredoxin-related protein